VDRESYISPRARWAWRRRRSEASREKLTSLLGETARRPSLFSPPESPDTLARRTFTDEELFQRQVEALKLIPAARRIASSVGYGGAFVLPRHTRMVQPLLSRAAQIPSQAVTEVYQLSSRHEAGRMIKGLTKMAPADISRGMTDMDWTMRRQLSSLYRHEHYPLPGWPSGSHALSNANSALGTIPSSA